MSIFKNRLFKKLSAVAIAVTVALIAILTVTASNPGDSSAVSFGGARDCDANAVIYCGTKSSSELSNNYFHGNSRNSAQSIQNIYSGFGINGGDIHNATTTAQAGYVTKSGNVVVNGKVVATGAVTAGRQYIPGSARVSYGGTTFYKRAPRVSFQQSSLSAFVVMKNGVFQFAIISSCGNPVTATPTYKPQPKPVLVCKYIEATPLSKNRYRIAVAAHGEHVSNVSYVIGFGDGSKSYHGSHNAVSHTYAKPGTYNIKAYVTSNQIHNVTSAACAGKITITPTRALVCDSLSATKGEADNEYNFELKASGSNVIVTGYSIDFGDGTVKQVKKAGANGLTDTISHTYAKPGNYQIKATVNGLNGNFKDPNISANCAAEITVPVQPPEECKPGVPVDSPECETTPLTPVTPTTPQTPTKLVNTGPGAVIGMFSATTLAGTFVSKLFLRKKFLG